MPSWRIHKTLAFVVLGATILAMLGFLITLDEKFLGLFQWKYALAGGLGYVIWVFNKLLHG